MARLLRICLAYGELGPSAHYRVKNTSCLFRRELSPAGQVVETVLQLARPSGLHRCCWWLAEGSAETHVAGLAVLPATLLG
ncbi:hypothetical protein MHYP_G00025840 [Metynnis hypsauchen]